MNKPLQLFYDKITYKMWLVQFFLLDCDIIKTIKYLVKCVGLKRTIKPLTMAEISQYNGAMYYNHEGIAYLNFYQPWILEYPEQYIVNTHIWFGAEYFNCIRYIYMDLNKTVLYKFTVDYEKSCCDYPTIHLDLALFRWHEFDYPIDFDIY